MKSNPRIFIGTSGWSHDSWKGGFYPEKLPKVKYLDHYASRFQSVEMNSVFYQLPPAKVLAQATREVQDDFLFSVKGTRYITYIKRLKDAREILPPFLSRMDILGEYMGPIALQLPPKWGINRDRLKSFLEAMPSGLRFVFEFHDASWFTTPVYEALAEKNAALGMYQAGEKITPRVATADFVYLRMHNPKVKKRDKIAGLVDTWGEQFRDWLDSGKDVFCYFDQAGDDCAALDALRFREAIENEIGAGAESGKLLNAIGFAQTRNVPQQQIRAS